MPPDQALRALSAHLAEKARPILESVREEARFRYCFYLGVEHLFVALVKSADGRFAGALASMGADSKPVRDAVRRFAGAGGAEEPFAAPIQPTPRLQRIVKAASERAKARGEEGATEVDLVAALFADPDASPTIVLSQGGVDLPLLLRAMETGQAAVPALADGKGRPAKGFGKRGILARYGRDLTALAAGGELPDVIGREREIREILRALCRQTKNAPLLIGEAGVGKSAVIEGLAHRISRGEVPSNLTGKKLIEISLTSLVAGTKYRGEFEERMEGLIAEAKDDPDVLLFIDEIHSLVGAGRGDGPIDAGDILKPALARGEIRVIGATTPAEYSKSIEKDGALARRFQTVRVEEPSPEEAIQILEGRRASLSEHHGFEIEPEAIRAAVALSVKYQSDRRLPDKALDLLDEACARLRVRSVTADMADRVTGEMVAAALADKTGIPITRLTENEQERLLHMEDALLRRIVGQDAACRAVAEKIRLARAGLRDPRKPTGVFFFLGPSGVGKTELAKALAEFLMGSDRDIVRIDMSEYKEQHTISRLIGSPPGYVDSEEEGQLTGRLRRRPASVVLLDEVEKAHPNIWDLFLQVFDDGRLTDAQGRTCDCRHALFVMTSNVGSELWKKAHGQMGFGLARKTDDIDPGAVSTPMARPPVDEVLARLRSTFRPEFLNRVDEFVLFDPLGIRELASIARIQLQALIDRLGDRGIRVEPTEAALREIAERGYDPAQGARPIERAVEELVARPMSRKILAGEVKPGETLRIDSAEGELRFDVVTESEEELSGAVKNDTAAQRPQDFPGRLPADTGSGPVPRRP